jgi:hypothetical protein
VEPFTGFAKAQAMTIPEVLNRIAFLATLPTPVSRLLGLRPHPKAIAAATPRTGAGMLAAMGARYSADGGISTDQVEHVHREDLLARMSVLPGP